MINKTQGILILAGVILIQLFYFGFDTVQMDKDLEIEGTEPEVSENIDISHRIEDAVKTLSVDDRDSAVAWMDRAETGNIHTLKQLTSFWVSKGKWVLAGHYSEQIARQEPSSENWAMAANTFATGAGQVEEAEDRTFLSQKALSLYNKAIEISQDPFPLELKKTLHMISHPVGGNPMGGIQALMQLSEKYPNRPEVFFQLGRFAVQTGQWEKAQERLERANELAPENKSTICLLTDVYEQLGNKEKAAEYRERCNQ